MKRPCHASIRTLSLSLLCGGSVHDEFRPELRRCNLKCGLCLDQSHLAQSPLHTGPRAFSMYSSLLRSPRSRCLLLSYPYYLPKTSLENSPLLRQPDLSVATRRCRAARRLLRSSTSGEAAPQVCGLRLPRHVFGHSWLLRPQRSLARGV
jgi:hypothetical protein